MSNLTQHPVKIDTGHYYVLAPMLPYVETILHSASVSRPEFLKIIKWASGCQNDPRLVDMVWKAGDVSAKVPYLLEAGETPDSILATLREIAQPHAAHLQSLPDAVQTTIHLLLSINTVPRGCEKYGIPALLEIDCMQGEIVQALHRLRRGRQLAADFHAHNQAALQRLDEDWPRLRAEKSPQWPNSPLPEKAQMHFQPFFDKEGRLAYVQEACVIVDAPDAHLLQAFIPPILRHPLPANVPVPVTGSADWLLREVGKIGRHFTRALLGIIKARLTAERVALDARNYDLINQHAQEALQELVETTP
jgi:hypothetical protein